MDSGPTTLRPSDSERRRVECTLGCVTPGTSYVTCLSAYFVVMVFVRIMMLVILLVSHLSQHIHTTPNLPSPPAPSGALPLSTLSATHKSVKIEFIRNNLASVSLGSLVVVLVALAPVAYICTSPPSPKAQPPQVQPEVKAMVSTMIPIGTYALGTLFRERLEKEIHSLSSLESRRIVSSTRTSRSFVLSRVRGVS